MPYAAEIQFILSWWTIIGYFLTLLIPKNISRKQTALWVFACGPLAWLYVAGFYIMLMLGWKPKQKETQT